MRVSFFLNPYYPEMWLLRSQIAKPHLSPRNYDALYARCMAILLVPCIPGYDHLSGLVVTFVNIFVCIFGLGKEGFSMVPSSFLQVAFCHITSQCTHV